jgi:molecular chaperone DnaK
MDDSEVDRLVKEAEAKKEEDKKRKESADARNHADSTIAQAEKLIRDNADKVDEADKKSLEEKISSVKEVLGKTDASKDELEAKSKELSDELMKVGQKLYQQPGSTPNGEAPKNDGGVVD